MTKYQGWQVFGAVAYQGYIYVTLFNAQKQSFLSDQMSGFAIQLNDAHGYIRVSLASLGNPINYNNLPPLPPDPTPIPVTDANKCWAGYYMTIGITGLGTLIKWDRAGNQKYEGPVDLDHPQVWASLVQDSLKVTTPPLKDPLPAYPECTQYEFHIESP